MTHSPYPLDFLKLLAHDVRWELIQTLAESDHRVQELVLRLKRPQNLISYHLRLLREGQLIQERRSSADRRDVYYRLNIGQLRDLFWGSGKTLHPALVCESDAEDKSNRVEGGQLNGRKQPYRVLFLCTHNSARSQLAEGILRARGGKLVEVFSAGDEPSDIHPLAIKAAQSFQIDISGQHSKHMRQFTQQSFDYIITVCDKVRESCPVFPNDHKQIHWSFPDPTAVSGSEEEQYAAFAQTARELITRSNFLLLTLERQKQTP